MSNSHEKDVFVIIEHLQGRVSDLSYVMLAGAHDLAAQTGGQVTAVLLAHESQELANDLAADRVLYVDHPALAEFSSDAYKIVVQSLFTMSLPRAVLLGSTTIGADIASSLSVRLNLPLVGLCRTFSPGGRYISQIYGGKMYAEGALPEPSSLVTMIPGGYKPDQGRSDQPPPITEVTAPDLSGLRVTLTGYLEPDASDVDIASEPILIAVGRGVQTEDNIELAEEFAELLGGTVCASRPIIDQGWLPNSRMVGKSGKSVKPKLYLAMGISGAPEHVEAITGSEMIIAINTDPAAPIFDLAQYGAEVDMLDLLEALIDRLG